MATHCDCATVVIAAVAGWREGMIEDDEVLHWDCQQQAVWPPRQETGNELEF